MNLLIVVYLLVVGVLTVFSYGFTDLHLQLSTNPLFVRFHEPLFNLVNRTRPAATVIFFVILVLLSVFYLMFLRRGEKLFTRKKPLVIFLVVTGFILALSFCAFTYDLFNYIMTAKVLYTYHENPYVVMPIEIPNEPFLAFTRAANKLALYGPMWLAITAVPHYLGGGNIWRTIIAFKFMNAAAWLLFSYLIYRVTKSVKNVIFFALNPLVLIEVLVSGHNDIYMMILALVGLLLWRRNSLRSKVFGCISFFMSWWVKGATIILTPLFLLKKISLEKFLIIAYWLLAFVFFVATPIREELYPWYAVWLISVVSLLPLTKHTFLVEFSIVLSFALELRQMPYMWMGYYGGPGPMLRLLVTVIPVAVYLLIWGTGKYFKKTA